VGFHHPVAPVLRTSAVVQNCPAATKASALSFGSRLRALIVLVSVVEVINRLIACNDGLPLSRGIVKPAPGNSDYINPGWLIPRSRVP
jgi:hypothetical protein